MFLFIIAMKIEKKWETAVKCTVCLVLSNSVGTTCFVLLSVTNFFLFFIFLAKDINTGDTNKPVFVMFLEAECTLLTGLCNLCHTHFTVYLPVQLCKTNLEATVCILYFKTCIGCTSFVNNSDMLWSTWLLLFYCGCTCLTVATEMIFKRIRKKKINQFTVQGILFFLFSLFLTSFLDIMLLHTCPQQMFLGVQHNKPIDFIKSR